MQRLQRFVKLSLAPMAVLLPFWLTIGRAMLGSAGWLTLIFIFTVGPALLLAMILLAIVIGIRKDVRASGLVSRRDALLITPLYLTILLFGLFVVDGGDTEDSVGSVATRVAGRAFASISEVIALVFAVASAGLLAAALVVAIAEQVESRRAARLQQEHTTPLSQPGPGKQATRPE